MGIVPGKCQIRMLLVFFGISSEANVPANFVLGDSLVDAGNNNYIASLSKADCFPNGIDLGKPTGRYTNGRTINDIIGQEMGLQYFTPPFLAPTTSGGPVILLGVNYASGVGGILNNTGNFFGGRINLDEHLDNFVNTRDDIISRLGVYEAMQLFEKALFSVTIGSNDLINNYLTPIISTLEQNLVSPQTFVSDMLAKYTLQLTRLYNMGARKIVVANIGPIGCIPYQRVINPSAGIICVIFPNQLAQMFNVQLKKLVADLNAHLNGAKFVYADVYHIVDDIIENHQSYGFENANSACCYVGGNFGGLVLCGPISIFCPDRSKYVFWDAYHPSEAANQIIAKRLMDGDCDDVSPINIRNLMQL